MTNKSFDEIDVKIIRMLQNEARTSFKEIANQCNVTIDTIKNRYKALKKTGIIRGSTIVLNPKEMTKGNLVFFGIQIMHHYSDSVMNLVKKIPGMYVVTKSIGRYDIEAIAILDDIERIGAAKNTIGDFQEVKNVDVDILVDKPLLCPRNFEFD